MNKNYYRSYILRIGVTERKIFLELILSRFFWQWSNIKQACSTLTTNKYMRKNTNRQELCYLKRMRIIKL